MKDVKEVPSVIHSDQSGMKNCHHLQSFSMRGPVMVLFENSDKSKLPNLQTTLRSVCIYITRRDGIDLERADYGPTMAATKGEVLIIIHASTDRI